MGCQAWSLPAPPQGATRMRRVRFSLCLSTLVEKGLVSGLNGWVSAAPVLPPSVAQHAASQGPGEHLEAQGRGHVIDRQALLKELCQKWTTFLPCKTPASGLLHKSPWKVFVCLLLQRKWLISQGAVSMRSRQKGCISPRT